MNSNLDVEEHDPVTMEEAIHIAEIYFRHTNEKFQFVEEAIAATMFGFGSQTEFIEFCGNGSENISYMFEAPNQFAPWLLKVLLSNFQYRTNLRSWEEMVQRIQDFFLSPSDEIYKYHKKIANTVKTVDDFPKAARSDADLQSAKVFRHDSMVPVLIDRLGI